MAEKQYKNYRTRQSFISAFKKSVPNFDETKIWFEFKSKVLNGMNICFVSNGQLKKCHVHLSEYYVELWKQHFIEFLTTGIFDFTGYHKLYENSNIAPEDKDNIYAFPLSSEFGNDCYTSSDEMMNFLAKYRNKYPNCGIKSVPKPI